MHLINDFRRWVIISWIIIQTTADIPLSPYASWDQNAVTIDGLSNGTSGSSLTTLNQSFGISITDNDVLYISDTNNDRIVVVDLISRTNISIIGSGPGSNPSQFNQPCGIFIKDTSLYVSDFANYRVQQSSLDGSNPTTVPGIGISNLPYYLYVDNDNNIYLSDTFHHRVLFFPCNSSAFTMVAGNSTAGSLNNQLNQPYGVFVNQNGTMYIADNANHRIMKWYAGATFGIIVAGNGTNAFTAAQLNYPAHILLDSNEYMYISEVGNQRITRWAPNSTFGVCIAGCTGLIGTDANQLNGPIFIAFDSNGSLYVSDRANHRVQKFQILDQYQSPSYNQPKFSSCVSWNTHGITFTNDSTIGVNPTSMFVDINNTVYVVAQSLNNVLIWLEGNNIPIWNISNGLNNPFSIFATTNGHVYIDNDAMVHRVDQWSWNQSRITVMNLTSRCYSLFVDTNDNLYCSHDLEHKVIKTSLTSGSITTVAGTGVPGLQADMLDSPNGIFVDKNFNLYVADFTNNRIQLFPSGQLNGTTVVINQFFAQTLLTNPTGVVLDADENLFVVYLNGFLIRSGSSGSQCLIGCTGVLGSASNQLYNPRGLNFDSHGNLLVLDSGNIRIQKFLLTTNSCGVSYNQPIFSSCATWNPNAQTYANSSWISAITSKVFVSINSTIYLTATAYNCIFIWLENNGVLIEKYCAGLSAPYSIFVTINGDIYIDNGNSNHRVDKLTLNAVNSTAAMYVPGACYDLFVDIYNNIYCSISALNQVIQKLSDDDTNTTSLRAGNGISGATSYLLSSPRGIWVDANLNLYVADSNNNRIQFFQSGQLNGTTIPVNGAYETITLSHPTAIALDGAGYLFISDLDNNRIIGSSADGFRCIVGCTGFSGNESNQLNQPSSFSFDSNGNLYVVDYSNFRVGKFFLATNSCDVSYNQPIFSSCAAWNPNAQTFADSTTVGSTPYGVFTSTNNTVYVTATGNNCVYVWLQGQSIPTTSYCAGLANPLAIFVTIAGDVYVDNGLTNGQIDRWTSNATNITVAMYVPGSCNGLFVDIFNNIYCTISGFNQVIKKSFADDASITSIRAGNGSAGSAPNLLNHPWGIWVDIKLNLYVADRNNHRIQFFPSGQLTATTLVGSEASGTIVLLHPTAVVLDGNGNLFISDSGNNRIVGSFSGVFRCVVGCSSSKSTGANQLYQPTTLSFDGDGNLFVADYFNDRIQKFLIASNFCQSALNQPKFCPSATWNSSAITIANLSTINANPCEFFVDTNNTIYVPANAFNSLQVWPEENMAFAKNISSICYNTFSVFVTLNGNVYVDNGVVFNQVGVWNFNTSSNTTAMYVNGSCYDLFVDINNNLYCSLAYYHQVVKQSLYDDANSSIQAAGTGEPGGAADTLCNPFGIFVDAHLNLYVADSNNSRIQLFTSGSMNGTTVVGAGAIATITLNYPVAIVLDADGYLFISDYGNNRIVGSDINGYHCIAGCTSIAGSAADQLCNPVGLHFDSYGNLLVVDRSNFRIQKFLLTTNSCSQTITTTVSTQGQFSNSIPASSSTKLTTTTTSTSYHNGTTAIHSFIPSTCLTSTSIGSTCNFPADQCSMLKPCQHHGICINNNTIVLGYICSCPPGFDGRQCQFDHRPCQPNTCWNTGTCNQTSITTFICSCPTGWEGIYCETMINYCKNITCLNNGVCQSSLLNFTCGCVDVSYSGRYCEITANRLIVQQTISKSFAFIAIIAMLSAAIFIMVLDVLKYFFGVDLAENTLPRKKRKETKKKKPVIAIRYIYVHAPPTPAS